MKKLILLMGVPLFASAEYVSVIQNNDNNLYLKDNFHTETIYSEWVNIDSAYDCLNDIGTDDVYYNYTKIQTTTCKQKQERTKTTTKYYDSGHNISENEKETQIINTSTEQSITGTYLALSCKEILSFDDSISTGTNNVKTNDGTIYPVYCDMDTDGGGWTRLDYSSLTSTTLFERNIKTYIGLTQWVDNRLIFADNNSDYGYDKTVSLTFPFNYQEFYLKDYTVKSYNGNIEMGNTRNIVNNKYDTAVKLYTRAEPKYSAWGDVSFGTTANATATTSFSDQGANTTFTGTYVSPNSNIYDNGISSNVFSIRAVESGTENEDIYVWYSGYVFLR